MTTSITVRYGDSPEHLATLTVPDSDGPHRVVVLVHGGFWRAQYGLELMEQLVDDLVGRGFACWNIEYRRVGQAGGGYPGTLHDVAAAVDHLATLAEAYALDLGRAAVVGHSAGGHLALWLGSRALLEPAQPGAEPLVRPVIVVGLAAVADLPGAAREGLGNNATQDFMGGGPDGLVEQYSVANPVISARTVLIHGDCDTVVPVDQSTRFGDVAEVIVPPGEDHMAVIDRTSQGWAAAVDVISRL